MGGLDTRGVAPRCHASRFCPHPIGWAQSHARGTMRRAGHHGALPGAGFGEAGRAATTNLCSRPAPRHRRGLPAHRATQARARRRFRTRRDAGAAPWDGPAGHPAALLQLHGRHRLGAHAAGRARARRCARHGVRSRGGRTRGVLERHGQHHCFRPHLSGATLGELGAAAAGVAPYRRGMRRDARDAPGWPASAGVSGQGAHH